MSRNSNDLVTRTTDVLRAHGLRPGGRVLVLAPDAKAWQGQLERAGYSVDATANPEALPAAPSAFDAAVVVGILEEYEWDRWVLQQVASALRIGGLLVLRVPNFWGLATPQDASWVGRRVAAELARRLGRIGGRAPAGGDSPFEGRRYRASQLRALLKRLGYDQGELVSERSGREWLVTAKKSGRGVAGGAVPLADCASHCTQYEQANARTLQIRDQWARVHARFVSEGLAELDPAEWRGRAVLALSPHPDDEIVGAGGTLLRLVRAGARVTLIQATDGSDSWALRRAPNDVRRTVRMAEARAVAQAAGIERLIEWREDNRSFQRTDALVERLAGLLRELAPALVFTPFLTDAHGDHRTLNRILADALERYPESVAATRVLGYEVWGSAAPALFCDVTEVREEQEALLFQYPTGMKVDDFVELCEHRNYYNACKLLGRAGYAEVFHAAPATDYPGLVRSTYQG